MRSKTAGRAQSRSKQNPALLHEEQNGIAQSQLCRKHLDSSSGDVRFTKALEMTVICLFHSEELKKETEFDLL